MFLFIGVLAKGFTYVGQTLHASTVDNEESKFVLWGIGAALFAHLATMISVSYFDQSFLFLYLNLALIGSAWSGVMLTQKKE